MAVVGHLAVDFLVIYLICANFLVWMFLFISLFFLQYPTGRIKTVFAWSMLLTSAGLEVLTSIFHVNGKHEYMVMLNN